ncbi:hypothetical protein CHS0354_038105 [Potamilus streckersoni]|uniref:Major facilitator superfamily (MFS) profile domain-containing protein n=1 Tax=Potamilus streckersoni TaxID=2493646 RepID=A0AAE0SJH4_9BIVA|nr:hypothetical protein CHS0354_038105 [Potamilus streckersoni]
MAIMEKSTNEIKPTPLWCSTRLALTVMSFFGFVNLYALRVNMSVAMVCMVNQTQSIAAPIKNTNGSAIMECSNQSVTAGKCAHMTQSASSNSGGEFNWEKEVQGLVLGSFFWGYMVTQLPGGWLASHYGGKRVFGWFVFVCSVATLLTPFAARTDLKLLIAVRVIAGIGQGVVWPAMQVIWAHWAPPLEYSKLGGFCYAGAQVGNVITFPIAGLLCEYGFDGGWPSIFYILGGLGLVWFVAWMLVVADTPWEHSRISEEEKLYIMHSLKGKISTSKTTIKIPWLKIITSLPVWAIFVTHTCANWGTYTFMTNIPTYMKEVLKFDIKQNGALSALPYIGFWAMVNVSAHIADFLRRRKMISTTTCRKLFNSLGEMVPALFVVITSFMDSTQPVLAVVFLTLGVAFSGCQYGSGFVVNPVDIAPKYAGVIFGISNTLGTLGGILAPIAIGYITTDKTREQWQTVFYIAAAIYTFGALFFVAFGSGEIQEWAREKNEDVEIDVNNGDVRIKSGEKVYLETEKDTKL